MIQLYIEGREHPDSPLGNVAQHRPRTGRPVHHLYYGNFDTIVYCAGLFPHAVGFLFSVTVGIQLSLGRC